MVLIKDTVFWQELTDEREIVRLLDDYEMQLSSLVVLPVPLTLLSQRASATIPHPGLDRTASTGSCNIRTVHVLSLFLHFGARASRINP